MPWGIHSIMLFFALGDALLVSTEPLHTAILQIGKTTVVEGEKVEFKCLISAVHRQQPENNERNWFHLYKNREKISSLPEPGGMAAVTFIKQDIRKNDAGNYTCMYGNKNPGDVKNISHGSSVYLNVREYTTTPSQQNLTGDMTTPITSNKTQQTNETGSVPALYLGAGVGSGFLVLLLLLIGGVLKCLQSKRDIAVQTEPIYANTPW